MSHLSRLSANQGSNTPALVLEALQALIDEAVEKRVNELLAPLQRRVQLIEKGLDEWVGTKEALRITGIERRETLQKRAAMAGALIESKQEGNRHFYLRSSLVAYLEANPPRRYRARRIPPFAS